MPNATLTQTARTRRPLTPWELPALLTPMHAYRRSKKRCGAERPHFPAILGFVYRNRFAVSSQIQRRFATVLKSDRTARRHLEELETLGYLGVAPTRGVGPLFPKVYFVTGRGVRRLRESLAAQGKRWQPGQVDRRGRHRLEGFSAEHILHEILITEFLLEVIRTVDGRPDLELLTIQRRSLARHPAFRVGSGRLVPDALFLFRNRSGGMACGLLEMDTGTMNSKQIVAKYSRYEAWARSLAGQQYLVDLYRRHGAAAPRPAFRILFVVKDRSDARDDRRLAEVWSASRAADQSLRNRLWFTTVSRLLAHQDTPLPLAARIWQRPTSALSPTAQAPGLATSSPEQMANKRKRNVRLAREIAKLPSFSLFPDPS